MRRTKLICATAACIASFCVHQARARSAFPVGVSFGPGQACITVTTAGIINSCAVGRPYDVPLHIDNLGTKRIEVFGRRIAADMTCRAATITPTGSITVSSPGTITSTSYTSVTLSVAVSVAKSSVIVECVLPAGSGAVWNGVEYDT